MGHSYRELIVWQKAIGMVTNIYRATQSFPKQETYGLVSQIRRSAVSIPSNIAEGQGRVSRGEFRQFLGNARGSLPEMETQLCIANNLGYLSEETMGALMERSGEVSRLLHRLMQSMSVGTPEGQSKLETRN